jgi:hypothetical protein
MKVQIDWTSVLARCSLEQPLVGLLQQESPEMLVIVLVDVLAISPADMLEHWGVFQKPDWPLCKAKFVIVY